MIKRGTWQHRRVGSAGSAGSFGRHVRLACKAGNAKLSSAGHSRDTVS